MERRVLALFALFGVMPVAHALDFRSIEVPAAILYDAPSQKGKKLYLIRGQTPVEVVVRIEGWLKVRDAEGTLAWIEARHLGERRTLIVTAPGAEIRPCDKTDAAAVAVLDKWVVVDFVEPASPGWARVRHRDGATGCVRNNQVWGL